VSLFNVKSVLCLQFSAYSVHQPPRTFLVFIHCLRVRLPLVGLDDLPDKNLKTPSLPDLNFGDISGFFQ